MIVLFFCGGASGLVFGGGALLTGGCSVCDDLGGVSTGDEVMLTSPPELAHCAPFPLSWCLHCVLLAQVTRCLTSTNVFYHRSLRS